MNATHTLNIGLNDRVPSLAIIQALVDFMARMAAAGDENTSLGLYPSDTELTAVVQYRGPDGRGKALAELACAALNQEAVAWRTVADDGGVAAGLVGPKAAEWGPFNPAYFIVPGGVRLSDVIGGAA